MRLKSIIILAGTGVFIAVSRKHIMRGLDTAQRYMTDHSVPNSPPLGSDGFITELDDMPHEEFIASLNSIYDVGVARRPDKDLDGFYMDSSGRLNTTDPSDVFGRKPMGSHMGIDLPTKE